MRGTNHASLDALGAEQLDGFHCLAVHFGFGQVSGKRNQIRSVGGHLGEKVGGVLRDDDAQKASCVSVDFSLLEVAVCEQHI